MKMVVPRIGKSLLGACPIDHDFGLSHPAPGTATTTLHLFAHYSEPTKQIPLVTLSKKNKLLYRKNPCMPAPLVAD